MREKIFNKLYELGFVRRKNDSLTYERAKRLINPNDEPGINEIIAEYLRI